jgi:hypothetical protein
MGFQQFMNLNGRDAVLRVPVGSSPTDAQQLPLNFFAPSVHFARAEAHTALLGIVPPSRCQLHIRRWCGRWTTSRAGVTDTSPRCEAFNGEIKRAFSFL